MVGEKQVHPAGVQVDGGAEQRLAHGAAFDVPAGAALGGAVRAGPFDVAVLGLVGLPEGEVADVFLFVGVGGLGLEGGADLQLAFFDPGERAVVGVGGDFEVN